MRVCGGSRVDQRQRVSGVRLLRRPVNVASKLAMYASTCSHMIACVSNSSSSVLWMFRSSARVDTKAPRNYRYLKQERNRNQIGAAKRHRRARS